MMRQKQQFNTRSFPPVFGSSVFLSSLADVVRFWHSFDLDGKRQLLDKQGIEIAAYQEASAKSRKVLAERTKSFRREGVADKLKKIGSLLRSYQEEIDSLTRRGRFAESAFLSLYKELYEAPDPQHSLQSAHAQVEKSKSLRLKLLKSQSETKKLQNDLDEYESEFAKLKNQDITIRELEYKLEEFQKV